MFRITNKHGLFQRGVSPSAAMRAKMREAQRRRRELQHAEDQRELDAFIARVQLLLDDCYRRLRQQ